MRRIFTTVITSAMFLGAFISLAATSPVIHSVFQRAFGAAPLGLSIGVFSGLLAALLLAPFPIFVWHFTALADGARNNGWGRSVKVVLVFMSEIGFRDPKYGRDVLRTTILIAYFVALAVAWILYSGL